MGQATPELRHVTDAVIAELGAEHNLSPQSERRLTDLIDAFAAWCSRHRLSTLDDVSPAMAGRFLTSPTVDGDAPSLATQHLRRSAVRLLFRGARRLELSSSDPTLDLILPPRSSLALRPLTDDEVLLCRSCSLTSLTDTRSPAAWALAEATATTAEIPAVRPGDVDLESATVRLAGSTKREPRSGQFSDWGRLQIERRLRYLASESSGASHIVYLGDGSPESRQASSCLAIKATLVRAGLGHEPDVRPASVPAWAGATAFAAHGRIDLVARSLGLRSLDQAARAIAWDWATADG